MVDLPDFNAHGGHAKLERLTEPGTPWPSQMRWLQRVSMGRDRATMRVLDLGCGRGGIVAWLVEQGWDAFGVDVSNEYVDNGRAMLGDRLSVLTGASYPYQDNYFDLIISNQVFEHVADLDLVARELGRITKTGGRGLHIFPAKWIFREPHMHTPMVHWLPKGPLRRVAIKAALFTGRAADYFADRELDERTKIFYRYSAGQTFYRRPVVIRGAFKAAGHEVNMVDESAARVRDALGRDIPRPIAMGVALVYRTVRVVYLETVKADPRSG